MPCSCSIRTARWPTPSKYGDAGAVNAGEGTPAPQTAAGQSLTRTPPGSDTGDNAADFSIADPPTPGVGPSPPPPPPPSSGIEISLPDTSAASGDTLIVPIELGETTGLDIVAIELAISYDAELLTAGSVSTPSALLSSGWSLAQRVSPGAETAPDTLKIALATAADTLTGAGRLLAVPFAVADLRQPASSALNFEKVLLNTATDLAIPHHGRVILTGADGALTVTPSQLQPPDTLTVTVVDPDENRDPEHADRIFLTLVVADLAETLAMDETGPNTGTFSTAISVVSGTPSPNDGPVELPPDSSISVCYEDLLTAAGQQDLRCATAAYRAGRDARLNITRVVQPGDTLWTHLVDPDLNLDPTTRDLASVTAENQDTGEGEPLLLVEAGLDDSVFFGQLATAPEEGTSGDGLLGARRGDRLRLTFLDTRSSSGSPREVEASAICVGRFGDADGNGRVQAFDASRVLVHVLAPQLTGLDSLAANVDSLAPDGSITPYDAALILQHRVGLRRRFPVQQADACNQPRPVSHPKPTVEVRRLAAVRKSTHLAIRLDARDRILSGDLLLEGLTGRVEISPEMRGFALASRPLTGGLRVVLAGPGPVSGPGELLRVYPDIPPRAPLQVQGTFNDGRIIALPAKPLAPLTGLRFALFPNIPNPFNPETAIHFVLPQAGPVRLEIFDVLGRQVRTLVSGQLGAGVHRAVWDGRNQRGARVGSGVYFCRLCAGPLAQTSRMLLIE